jgi:hypothetical protein
VDWLLPGVVIALLDEEEVPGVMLPTPDDTDDDTAVPPRLSPLRLDLLGVLLTALPLPLLVLVCFPSVVSRTKAAHKEEVPRHDRMIASSTCTHTVQLISHQVKECTRVQNISVMQQLQQPNRDMQHT